MLPSVRNAISGIAIAPAELVAWFDRNWHAEKRHKLADTIAPPWLLAVLLWYID